MVVKKTTLPRLIEYIESHGYTNIKVEKKVISFNILRFDFLTKHETHDLFMQWLSSAFVFGFIKGVRYQKGRTRVWVMPTKTYDSYAGIKE